MKLTAGDDDDDGDDDDGGGDDQLVLQLGWCRKRGEVRARR